MSMAYKEEQQQLKEKRQSQKSQRQSWFLAKVYRQGQKGHATDGTVPQACAWIYWEAHRTRTKIPWWSTIPNHRHPLQRHRCYPRTFARGKGRSLPKAFRANQKQNGITRSLTKLLLNWDTKPLGVPSLRRVRREEHFFLPSVSFKKKTGGQSSHTDS